MIINQNHFILQSVKFPLPANRINPLLVPALHVQRRDCRASAELRWDGQDKAEPGSARYWMAAMSGVSFPAGVECFVKVNKLITANTFHSVASELNPLWP